MMGVIINESRQDSADHHRTGFSMLLCRHVASSFGHTYSLVWYTRDNLWFINMAIHHLFALLQLVDLVSVCIEKKTEKKPTTSDREITSVSNCWHFVTLPVIIYCNLENKKKIVDRVVYEGCELTFYKLINNTSLQDVSGNVRNRKKTTLAEYNEPCRHWYSGTFSWCLHMASHPDYLIL